MRLESFLKQADVLVIEEPGSRNDVLERIAEAAATSGGAEQSDLLDSLLEREKQMPTSTPEGVGFPHALLPAIEQTRVIAALLKPGVSFGVADHPPVDLVFGMFGSSEKPWEHVRLLARLARIARGEGALERLRAAADEEALYEALIEEDRSHV